MPRYSLKRSPWSTIDVARRLVRTGEQRAEHHRVRSGRDRLGDVAGGGEPAVGDHRHAVPRRHLRAIVDRRDLRHADAGDDARRADRPGPDAGLDGVRAGSISASARLARSRCCRRRDRRRTASLSARAIAITPREWPCAVSTTSTSTPAVDQRLRALERVRPDADGRADAEPAAGVLRRVRVLDRFSMSLTVIRPAEDAVRVDDRQLLDLVAVQDLLGLLERRADRRGHEIRARSSARRRAGPRPSRSGGRGW